MPVITSDPLPDTVISEINLVEVVQNTLQNFVDNKLFYYDSLLPLLFRLKGKPLTLNNHFQMKALFARVLPEQVTFKTGRQVSKSFSNATHSVLMGVSTPYYNILHVTPLYEMIRKFSSNYVAPLISESPLQSMFVTPQSNRSVLQSNRSVLQRYRVYYDRRRPDAGTTGRHRPEIPRRNH